MNDRIFVLLLNCEDRPGIVAATTTELANLGGNIVESNQFWDRETNRFFMRVSFSVPEGTGKDDIAHALKPVFDRFAMKSEIVDQSRVPAIVIMVSKFDHAMLHLLYQIRVNWLNAKVVAIVSNHEVARQAAEINGVPFHHWPVTAAPRPSRRRRSCAWCERPAPIWSCWRATCRCCPTTVRAALRHGHQHPPFLPARLQGRQALPPGACARREADRRHGALRDPRPRRGPDHRAGVERVSHAMTRRTDFLARRPRRREPGAGARREVPPGKPGAAQRPQDRGVLALAIRLRFPDRRGDPA